ncbi:MAG: mandelate racemase/muconate lactonizing enzyme family protein [Actinomycetota bacterium]|nr:mandelate racemase/muconate lactonizing enzyme family protein [Actinomycetota bacterium]
MRITELETIRVSAFPNLIFVRLYTDEKVVGLGETFYGAEAVEAHLHSVVAGYLLGEDPLKLERHSEQLAGYVGFRGSGVETRSRSAVDIALWDILGQVTGQPVFNLLGGQTRPDIAIYNTCAGAGYVNSASGQAVGNWGVKQGRYEDLYAAIHHPGKLARDLLDQGIRGMKVWPFDAYAERSAGHYISSADLNEALARIAEIRDAVGGEMEIMVELHALWDVPSARKIVHALEEFEPMWVEDPVRSDIVGGLQHVAADTPLRIAAGETVGGIADFQTLLAQRALGVVTVDTTWSGGLTTARKVADIAAAHGIPIAPHDCTGPVALTACVHLSAAASNALIQETVRAAYLGWYSTLVEGGASIAAGRVQAPSEPGLGVRLLPDLADRPGSVRRTSRLPKNGK